MNSTEETYQIQHCKDQAMSAVGATSMYAVHINPARRIQFYEVLNNLCQTQFGWDRTYSLLEIAPVDIDEACKYANADIMPMKNALNSSIKSTVITQLRDECEQADKKYLDEWENDCVTSGFKLDHMTAESLIHVLENEIYS